jgi:hypothetical protein
MWVRPIAPAPVLVAACLALVAGVARAQGDQVDIEVMNRSFQPVAVEIRDDICRQSAFTGEIVANASVAVTACADQDGLATITVMDRQGHRRTYPGLADPSTVNVEFE